MPLSCVRPDQGHGLAAEDADSEHVRGHALREMAGGRGVDCAWAGREDEADRVGSGSHRRVHVPLGPQTADLDEEIAHASE